MTISMNFLCSQGQKIDEVLLSKRTKTALPLHIRQHNQAHKILFRSFRYHLTIHAGESRQFPC